MNAVPISKTPAAAVEYVKAGWVLVPFDRGLKGPDWKGWNLRAKCISTVEQASDCHVNIGIAHAYSGPYPTCCLDIDNFRLADSWLGGAGIDLKALCADRKAVLMSSGRRGRIKLMYSLGPNVPLLRTRSFKGDGIELRCATAEDLTVQDVLPPSIHPVTGRPYRWLRSPDCWRNLPIIPVDVLAFWQSLNTSKETPAAAGAATPSGMSREDIEAVLKRIKASDLIYDDWRDVGFALHHETRGDQVGLDIWENFSQSGGKKYKGPDELISKWAGFTLDHENPVTLRSLERLASPVDMRPEYEVQPEIAIVVSLDNGNPAVPKFKIETPTEFAACEYEDDFIDGVLPDAPYGVIMGQSGSGKTFAAMDLAFAMARGVCWRGRDTKPARVLYIAAEGAVGVRKRLNAYAQHHGVALSDINVEFLGAAPDLTQATDVRALIDSIKARSSCDKNLSPAQKCAPAYTHIVIDTWSQVTPGADENSSHDMGAALKHVQTIHRATGARILIVAHMGKDMTKGMRGWSGFKAAMDYEIEVARDGEQRTLTVTKSRDSMDGVRFAFHLQPVTLGVTKRGKPVVSCVVVHDMGEPAKKRRPPGALQLVMLATLQDFFDDSGDWLPVDKWVLLAKNRLATKKGEKDQRVHKIKKSISTLVKNSSVEEKDGKYRPFPISEDIEMSGVLQGTSGYK
jgi:hypothetical protein